MLEDIALELEDLRDEQTELADGLDAVSDDLEDVEDVIFGDEDEDDEDDEDCYATTCPTCGETIYFDETILEDGRCSAPTAARSWSLTWTRWRTRPPASPRTRSKQDGRSRPAHLCRAACFVKSGIRS